MRVPRVLLVDDHPLFRAGLASLLEHSAIAVVAAEAGTCDEALAHLEAMEIDLAVVDLLLPRATGMTLAAAIHERHPGVKVMGLSVIAEPSVIGDFMRTPAAGYATKSESGDAILAAIRAVLAGDRAIPNIPGRDAILADLARVPASPLALLTRREREVFDLLVRGCTNVEIASRLFIARRTVETHRYRITRKLSRHTVPQLQRLAARYETNLAS